MRPLADKTARHDASALGGSACIGVPMWGGCGFDADASTPDYVERRSLTAGNQLSAGRHYPRIQPSHQTSQ